MENQILPLEDINCDLNVLSWKTFEDKTIVNLEDQINNDIQYYLNQNISKNILKFIVASDSQRRGSTIKYVTTIIFLRVGMGGNAYYVREYVDIPQLHNRLSKQQRSDLIKSIVRDRIWTECMKSVACAKWVDKILAKYQLKVEEIHSDINFSKKYLSNQLLSAVNGYIAAQQYKSVVKPNCWGASKIADCKTK